MLQGKNANEVKWIQVVTLNESMNIELDLTLKAIQKTSILSV